MKAPGVFVEVLTLPPGLRGERWEDWYDETYLAPRAQLPGVAAARRGRGIVGSVHHLVVYDLDDFLAPRSAAWEQVGRGAQPPSAAVGEIVSTLRPTLFRQILSTVAPYVAPPTPVLHGAFFEVETPHHGEFNDWYDTEHVRFVEVIDGYLNCRRFQSVDDPTSFLALYDVDSLAVAESEETARANQSPWSDRVRSKLTRYRERRLFEIERRAVNLAALVPTP